MKREVQYFLYKSPIGILPVAYSEDGVFFLELKSKLESFIGYLRGRGLSPVKAEKPPRRLVEELDSYFSGRRVEFSYPVVFLWGTGFQRAVWNTIREIPYGETRSYAWLARRVGRPKAYRAVGNAVGANPVPILVPCHRVIRSDGSLGGFRAGLELKRWLLELEGVVLTKKGG